MGQRWEELRDTLSEDLHNTNQIAMSIAKGYMPEVYALNYNYGTFAVERQGHLDTSFTLIDHNFVERLVRDNPKLLPDPTPGSPAAIRIARNKDVRWNRNKLQSAMIQGCLQGESIGKIANRFQRVTDMNRTQALRHARTAVNGAANGGRLDSYRRAERMGIDLVKEWSAVLDNVTRDSHVDVNGERRGLEEEFSNGLMYPGGMGPPEEVYNCRCDLISWVKGFEPSQEIKVRSSDTGSFKEWEDEASKKGVVFDRGEKGFSYDGKRGIIKKKREEERQVNMIKQPIEQRQSARGNPNAIIQYGMPLNKRQQRLLDQLPDYDSRVIVPKGTVKMTDLSALTAVTGDEFAMFTKGNERLIIRGDKESINIFESDAIKLNAQGFRWSGHTHPGLDKVSCFASPGDVGVLGCFDQEKSVIYNSKGQFEVFGKGVT